MQIWAGHSGQYFMGAGHFFDGADGDALTHKFFFGYRVWTSEHLVALIL